MRIQGTEFFQMASSYVQWIRMLIYQILFFYSICLNQNSIYDEIKCRLKTGNSCYSAQTLSSLLPSKNLKIKIYITIILPVVLYFCGIWYLTTRQECRLNVFENRILRKIYGPKRNANGEWRRLHNKELNSLYHSPNIVRVIKSRSLKWAGHVARMVGVLSKYRKEILWEA